MKATTKDMLKKQQGETPNSRSTPSIIIGNGSTEELQPHHDEVNISNATQSQLLPEGGFVDLEENSSRAPTGNNDSAENSQSTISGVASVNSTAKSLDSVQRGARRGAARKKKQYQDDTSLAGNSAISQETVQTNDTSYTSPGAVSVQGIGFSSHHNSISDEAGRDHCDNGTDMPYGTEHDPHDDFTSSLIITARLVSENPLMPEFLEEHLERRIQEGVESRLRATQQEVLSKPPQQPIISTVIAEPMDPANAISHGADKLNPANPSEGFSRKVCRVHPLLLLVLAVMVVVGAVTGIIFAIKSTQPNSSEQPIPTNRQLLERLEPWIIRTDNEDREVFHDPASPQAQALEWLSDEDTNLSEDRPTAVVLERYALAVLYYSTNGRFWVTQDYGFLSNTADVCSWNNDTSWDDPSARGIFCGNSSSVEYILLEEEGLSGTIPWELSLLSDLLSLRLSGNNLRSSIPTELGQLTRLQELHLYGNRLEGRLPCEIGQSTGLQRLWLDGNELTGTLPTEFGKLSALTLLSFTSNWFTGTLPTELGQLMNLTGFWVNNNNLNGTVPTELGQMTYLTHLDLDLNAFTGTLPTELGEISSFQFLWAANNQFNGTLPTEFSALTALKYLSVHKNGLQGTIPTEWGSMTDLEDCRLSSNTLTGTLPSEMGKLGNLWFFSVEDNMLTGTVPTELGHLTNLSDLYFNKNLLNGTVPTEFGQLTGLSYMWLQMNRFTGILPMDLSELSFLLNFSFHQNDLTGTVNDIFCVNSRQWQHLQSDCLATNGEIEIRCDCCNVCCNADGTHCRSMM